MRPGSQLAGDVQAQLEHRRQLDRAAADDHDQRVGKLEQQPEVEPDDRRDADVQPGDGEGRADDVLARLALEDRAESREHGAGALDRVVREEGVERAPIGEPRVQGVLVDPAVDPDDAADGAEREAERELDRRQEVNAEHDHDRRRPVGDVEPAEADDLSGPEPNAERAGCAVAVPHERPRRREAPASSARPPPVGGRIPSTTVAPPTLTSAAGQSTETVAGPRLVEGCQPSAGKLSELSASVSGNRRQRAPTRSITSTRCAAGQSWIAWMSAAVAVPASTRSSTGRSPGSISSASRLAISCGTRLPSALSASSG